jgi:ribosome biogenesis protein NSA1
MRIVCGDETGLVKLVDVKQGKVVAKVGRQAPEMSVAPVMAWVPEVSGCKERCLWSTASGDLNSWELPLTKTQTVTTTHEETDEDGEDVQKTTTKTDVVVGTVAAMRKLSISNKVTPVVGLDVDLTRQRVITCNAVGQLDVTPMNEDDFGALAACDKKQKKNKVTLSFQVGSPVERCRYLDGHVAVGGKELDVHVWDVETQTATFKARNVKHDFLDMRVPVWVTDLGILSAAEHKGKAHHMIATGTAYGQVRVYDTRAQRRPIHDWNLEGGLGHLTAVLPLPNNSLLVADTVGRLLRMDLSTGKCIASYRGSGGSLRALAAHPTEPVIAAAGLDRTVRVYDMLTRKTISRTYVKQRVTSLVFSDVAAPVQVDPKSKNRRDRWSRDGAGGGGGDDDDDDDDVWGELDGRAKKKAKRVRRSVVEKADDEESD